MEVNYELYVFKLRETYYIVSFIDGFVINYMEAYLSFEKIRFRRVNEKYKLGEVGNGIKNLSFYARWILFSSIF